MKTADPCQRTLRVEITNLREDEYVVLCAIIALFTDPHLGGMRRALLTGRLAVECDDGTPTWIHRAPGPARHAQN